MTNYRIMHPKEFVDALVRRELVPPHCQRIVIDISPETAIVYFQTLADERLLQVVQDPSIRIEPQT